MLICFEYQSEFLPGRYVFSPLRAYEYPMASFVHRIEVHYIKDPREKIRTDRIRSLGFAIEALQLVDVYTIATICRDLSASELAEISARLTNPIVQDFVVDEATRALFDYAIEVGFLPGVTDNVGATARQTIEDYLGIPFEEREMVSSSSLYLVRGRLAPDELVRLAATLANPLVNRVSSKTRTEYGEKGMDPVVPQVRLHEVPAAGTVDLAIPDPDLARLGKEGIPDPQTGQRRGPACA